MSAAKIAFCFLTYSNLERSRIWRRYIEPNMDRCSVYVHPKLPLSDPFFRQFTLKKCTPTYRKSDIFIVYATILLITEALKDERNKKIVFLSQSCLPIVSFNDLYFSIINDNKSHIKSFNNNRKDRFHQLSTNFKKHIGYHRFTKQHPNMILDRSHAEIFTNLNLLNHFKRMECPDEHYFVNILKVLNKDIENHQICFCNFYTNRTQGINHQTLSEKLMRDLRQKGYFFIRKINRGCRICGNYFNILNESNDSANLSKHSTPLFPLK